MPKNKKPSDYPLVAFRPSFKLYAWLKDRAGDQSIGQYVKSLLDGMRVKK